MTAMAIAGAGAQENRVDHLIPMPAEIKTANGAFTLSAPISIEIGTTQGLKGMAERLAAQLKTVTGFDHHSV